jgi:hypothetical protein
MELGNLLHKFIDCPVHWPAYDKNVFECRCGIIFPVYIVKAARKCKDWKPIVLKHKGGKQDGN